MTNNILDVHLKCGEKRKKVFWSLGDKKSTSNSLKTLQVNVRECHSSFLFIDKENEKYIDTLGEAPK